MLRLVGARAAAVLTPCSSRVSHWFWSDPELFLAASKRLSKKPEEYGRGSVEGSADATSANSSSLAGAWVPALVFGIPGDSVTAIVIGVLLMKNIKPGPEIFEKQAALVYSIFLIFFLANLVLIPVGFLAIKAECSHLIFRIPLSKERSQRRTLAAISI